MILNEKANTFLHNNLKREYQVLGQGDRILYAFHGFGRSLLEWEVFLPWLGQEFTIFAFADFFHGESEFPINRLALSPLKKEEITAFFTAFAAENDHSDINLMAYSSGGRTVLSLIEMQRFTINEVWLFAPDGIKVSFWNRMFTKHKLIQKLYKRIINKPDFFFKLARSLKKVKLLSPSLTYFVLSNMREKQKRQKIYNFWMVYREIIPDIKEVSQLVNEGMIRLHLIFGEEDVVIPPSIGRDFIKNLGKSADLLELKGGHLLIDLKHLEKLKERFPLK